MVSYISFICGTIKGGGKKNSYPQVFQGEIASLVYLLDIKMKQICWNNPKNTKKNEKEAK